MMSLITGKSQAQIFIVTMGFVHFSSRAVVLCTNARANIACSGMQM